jgi:hypothetical protein
MTTTAMKRIIAKIDREKNKIAEARDNIRNIYDDLGYMLECFGAGTEGLDDAIRTLTDAVDRISEVV